MYESIGINQHEVNLSAKKIRNLRSQLAKNVSKAKVVFPFDMYGGFKDFSEIGELGTNNKITEFSQYERVFTGKSSVVAIWSDSTVLKNEVGVLEKEFRVGEYVVGIAFDFNIFANTDNFGADKEFVELHDTEQLSMVFPATSFDESDIYKVFVIPQETNRWMRIDSITRVRDLNGEIVFTQVTFTSVNDLIEQTGLSLYNHIQRSAVGENYAWPLIDGDEIKHQVLGGDGVNEYQVEMLGNSLISGIAIIGRDVDNQYVSEPKWLLTSKLLQPIESQIKKTSPPDNNLMLLKDGAFTMQTYFQNWKQEMSQGYDLTIRKQYEGMFKFDSEKTEIINTRPNPQNIFDSNINFRIATGSETSIDGNISPYVRGTINFANGDDISPQQMLNLNALSYNWLTQLPQELEESVAWRTTDIPVIGDALNKFTLGIPFGHRNSDVYYSGKKINFFASQSQSNLFNKAVFGNPNNQSAPTGLIPAEAYDNTEESAIGGITGSRNVTMVFRGKLTDSLNDGALSTNLLGTDDAHKLAKDTKYDNVDNKYWIVDKFMMHCPTKADYILTFFKDGVRKWSSRYQTTAKWTNNIRNWLNLVSFSPWSSFYATQQGLNWNEIKEVPAPTGARQETMRQYTAQVETVTDSGIVGGIFGFGGHADWWIEEVKFTFEIPESVMSKYNHISIDRYKNGSNLPITDFDSGTSSDGEFFNTPTSIEFPIVKLRVTSDGKIRRIQFIYVGSKVRESDYKAFMNAMGTGLQVLTLLNV